MYDPPPSFLAKGHFSGEGGGGVYILSPPRGRDSIRPPLLYTPIPSQRAQRSKTFIIARTHERTTTPRMKFSTPPSLPRGPRDRKHSLSLERMKKTTTPRMKFSFLLEIYILGLKCSFSIENYNPGLVFLQQERGSE